MLLLHYSSLDFCSKGEEEEEEKRGKMFRYKHASQFGDIQLATISISTGER